MTLESVKIGKKISKLLMVLLSCFATFPALAQKEELVVGQGAHYQVTMSTSKGVVKMRLFNDTPEHRDNFVKLINDGFYNHLLFHRVVRNFMIQTGDPQSIEAAQVAVYGDDDVGYKLPHEIKSHYFHRQGMLAAAREGDNMNPERQSSGSQFFIVAGKVHNDSTLTAARKIIEKRNGTQITPEREAIYREAGGSPHLDGSYTIFGEVTSGLGTVVEISDLATDSNDRPLEEDVFIKKITLKVVKD